jgi:hypothetical protein
MTLPLSLCLGILSAACLAAEPEVLTLKPQLKKGDSFTLQITRSRQQTRGSRDISGQATLLADIAVLEAGPEGYVVSCTYRKTRVDGAEAEQIKANPASKILLDMWNNIPIHLKLSPDYAVTGLANYEAVKKAMDASTEKMLASMAFDAEKEKVLRQTVSQVVSSEQLVSQLVARELAIYLSFNGDFAKASDTKVSNVEFPSPYGGDPIPGKCTTKVESIDKKSGKAVVVRESEVDGKVLREQLVKWIENMDRKAGKEPTPGDQIPEMTMRDLMRAVIDLKTQLPQTAQMERITVSGPQKRVDGIKVMRLAAGADFYDEPKKGAESTAPSTGTEAPLNGAK